MKRMHWSWEELHRTPRLVLDQIVAAIDLEDRAAADNGT